MLVELFVKDFILIDEIHLSFQNGMYAFTGETGAGKSLIIDAISLLQGERVNTSYIRANCEQAIIEGVFEIASSHFLYKKMKEEGFLDENSQFIVSRTITKEGKHITKMNHRTITISFLKEIVPQLIDMHSQHDTQYLLNPRFHINLLDQFMKEEKLCQEVHHAYKTYKQELDHLQMLKNTENSKNDLDYLTYQFNEIDELNLKEEELEVLEQTYKELLSYEKINQHAEEIQNLLLGEQGGISKLYDTIYQLESLPEEIQLHTHISAMQEIYDALEEEYSKIQKQFANYEYDPFKLDAISKRIDQIHKVIRKYGGSVNSTLQKKAELESKIDQIIHLDDCILKQGNKVDEAYQTYYKLAIKLHNKREEKAKQLEEAIEQQLHQLHLEYAKFHVDIKEFEGNSKGIDQVSFLISLNVSQELQPLASTASGGELSRCMLGLKVIFAKLQGIQTVIFDEIDTGVSGRVAFAIGKKMQELSKYCQVLCVTHLPQVAACASKQILIEKQHDKSQTLVSIHNLSNEQRIQQLALLANNSTSEMALSAAKELFAKAQKGKI